MYYEDVTIKSGDTVLKLVIAYGYKATDCGKVWKCPKNAALIMARGTPDKVRAGDLIQIPIPWHVTSKNLTTKADGGLMEVERDGELGERLSFVQTVYRHNQPIGPNPNPMCVDACTPDDELPFYWTGSELKTDPALRKKFRDHSSRSAPTVKMGTTKWRAIVSLCAVTDKRVTVWDSLVWGWDMTPAKVVTTIPVRTANATEVTGHLNLLRQGKGMGPKTFAKQGWQFRTPPP